MLSSFNIIIESICTTVKNIQFLTTGKDYLGNYFMRSESNLNLKGLIGYIYKINKVYKGAYLQNYKLAQLQE